MQTLRKNRRRMATVEKESAFYNAVDMISMLFFFIR